MDWRRVWSIVSETLKWLILPLLIVAGSVFIYVVFRSKHPR